MKNTPTFPFDPVRENIVMVPLQEADQIGGIFIPETAKRSLNQGEVVKVGPEVTQCVVGDVVLFPLHQETRVQFEREWFYILDQNQILCKLAKQQTNSTVPEYRLEYRDGKYWILTGLFFTKEAAWASIGEDRDGYRVIHEANLKLDKPSKV